MLLRTHSHVKVGGDRVEVIVADHASAADTGAIAGARGHRVVAVSRYCITVALSGFFHEERSA
jgi:hypothetical protein